MDFWRSEYEEGNSTSSVLAGLQELIDSPNVSRDSIEYSSDDPSSIISDPAESLKVIQTPKATLLAKRRLQAYSAFNKFKPGSTREGKDETSNIDKPQKINFKKSRKGVYPDDAAKAVIRDIENLKRAGFGGSAVNNPVLSTSVPADIIPLEPFVPISLGKLNIDKSPTISLCSDMDEENLFKKREIKCRNIRKSETTSRRSPSPRKSVRGSKSENYSKKEKKQYPLNWTEYKELNLDPQKDLVLKSKLFKKPRSKHFGFKRYFNFELPSAPIENYKCQPISGDALWIPFPYIRSTASKPNILYSTNQQVTSLGYLTRKQLFSIISSERKALIEKLWKTPSRFQPSSKKSASRKWYPKNWKKFDHSEAKLLEKSVGLSFLQSYSDEEEDEVVDYNNEEPDGEVFSKTENRGSTSPSATPKEQPRNFDHDIEEVSEYEKNSEVNNWDELNISQCKNVFSNNDKTPPIEEKEEGEVSVEESPKVISEDEYQKTKKELESLEEALKESTNYSDNIDKILVETDDKQTKEKNKNKKSGQEKESKSKNRKNKSRKKSKKKLKDESEDSCDFEKEIVKKKPKKTKKYLKDKVEKKEKRRKLKKKNSKKKKEKICSSSESEVESDVEEIVHKKNKKRKSIDKSKNESTSEELNGKVHGRKSSVDITHEGYEDDVKFFTARFDNDDLKGKLKNKKDDSDTTKSVQNKIKTNIDLEELRITSKSENDKTIKRKSKYENSECNELLSLENIPKKHEQKEKHSEKQEGNRKRSNDRNKVKDDVVKSAEVKDERKKDEIKIDLLKKNEEYLREQDKLRVKQKKTSNTTCSDTELSIGNENENLLTLKSQKPEKHKTKDIQSKETNLSSGSKEQAREKLPKKPLKVSEAILVSDCSLLMEDKNLNSITEPARNISKQNQEPEEDKIKIEDDITKTNKHSFEKDQNQEHVKNKCENVAIDKNETTNRSKDDKKITDNCAFEHPEDKEKQPDWEQLKNKRKRHISDSTQEKLDKSKEYSTDSESVGRVEKFSPEKHLPIHQIKKEKDEKRESEANQEHSTYKQINTSWETDEEVIEVENPYCSGYEEKSLSLEIPLNIKHFTRREIKVESDTFDKDKEITPFQRHSPGLSAERKNLEAEKLKHLERQLLQNKEKELQQKKIKSHLKTKRDEKEQGEMTSEFNIQTPPKKRRWDIKSLDSTISTPKIKMEKSLEIIDVDGNATHNAVTLENEYEEFLKAVQSAKRDNRIYSANKPIVIDSSSDSSIALNEAQKFGRKVEISSNLVSEETTNKNSPFKQVITNLDDLVPKSKDAAPIMDIPHLQIPLPPIKPEEVRPVPVPLPKLEAVFDLNKPLINLSLSANVTQNITLSLATSVTSISSPITSSMDISKTSVEISTPVSKNTVVNMNNIPLPVSKTLSTCTPSTPATDLSDLKLATMSAVSPKSETLLSPKVQLSKGETNFPTVSPSDTGSENTFVVDKGIEKTPMKPKIIFASLTLPSKKQLLNNSSLNLDDSDNDDQSIIEELKRKKLEALIEDNKKEVFVEEVKKPVINEEKTVDAPRAKSPISNQQFSREDSFRKASPPKHSRRESSPRRKRESPLKRRDLSPRRRSPRRRSPPRRSPRRRSPIRKRSPHKRRSPGRRSLSPRKRRSISPRKRKSPSPRRKRSISPKNRQSPRRNRSISPRNKRSISPRSKTSRHSTSSQRNRSPKANERKKSPVLSQISSPFDGPKRSVADSTISDDQLPQSTTNDDYDSLFSHFPDKNREPEYDSPKRIPLDVRISQVLGYDVPCDEPQKPTSSTTYNYNDHQQPYQYNEQYSNIQPQITTLTIGNFSNKQGKRTPQSCYKQVGNMLQIVPNDDLIDIPIPEPPCQVQSHVSQFTHQTRFEQQYSLNMDIKPQATTFKQVGNIMQIVPNEMISTEMIPIPPTLTEVKIENIEENLTEQIFASTPPEKPSAEAAMLQKIAERRAERENRRNERERRRKEKEKRNKEKEKVKQAKMKIKTENMIKKALEMEQEENAEGDISGENLIQWPPLPIVVAHTVFKEAGKSILLTSGSRKIGAFLEEKRTKIVHFADGVKPGEGTSPSAGEELSSPPPPKKKLPKEKRYKKMKFGKKSAKKKVKVKIIKKPPSPLEESDTDDNLPPPSPPPGSPPPHIFPPRIKVNPVNNVPAAYLATIIQTAQQQQQQQQQQQLHQQQQQLHQQKLQQQQQQLQQQQQQYQSSIYCPPINLLMAPPPPPQAHPSAIPQHHQSPRGTTVPPAASPLGPQTHFHPSLPPPPPPPPPVSPHNHYPSGSSGQSGHHRHY